LRTINEDAVKKPSGAISEKIAAFWKSGMDSVAINKQGLLALKPELQMIDNIKTKEDILKMVAELDKKGINSMFFQLYRAGRYE
jgi:putative endopeptidase